MASATLPQNPRISIVIVARGQTALLADIRAAGFLAIEDRRGLGWLGEETDRAAAARQFITATLRADRPEVTS